MILKVMVLIMGLVIFIDLASLTMMWIKNMEALHDIKRHLTNEQEEKEIQEAMEEIEVL